MSEVMNEQERKLLFGLNETSGIGWRTIDKICRRRLLSSCGEALGRPFWEEQGFGPAVAGALGGGLAPAWINSRLEALERAGIGYILAGDAAYPRRLAAAPEPPWVLYFKGRQELLHSPSIAMVGTRGPTAYGKKAAESLSGALSAAGVTIISGLARGIDSVCHEAALRNTGSTIAVMATSLDQVYPPENRELAGQIAKVGLVLTEYPLGTRSHPGLFPQRNRIIAGLALGTIVVEADRRSGSLITADAALEANRDVFAVPGPVTSPKSRGANDLIRQGAKLVTCAEDVLEEYPFVLPPAHLAEAANGDFHAPSERSLGELELTSDESRLYHILLQGPFTSDELIERTNWEFGLLHSVLLSLIIKKAVAQLPGALYKVI